MSHNMITIVNRHTGFTRTIAENEFNNMIDKADYNCTSLKDDGDGIPDDNWTKKDITAYLRAKGIAYKSSYNKAKLLGMC